MARHRPTVDDRSYARLPTERVSPRGRALDALSPARLAALLAREERASARAVERAASAIGTVATRAADALAAGGRLIYVGAGTSGRLGALDAAECPPTFGTRPGQVCAILAGGPRAMRRAVEGAEDDDVDGRRQIKRLAITARDVVVGIAASGRTPFVAGALAAARARGAFTALVTCAPALARALGADVVVGLVVGPELLAGSTRLKAGTATKIALNAISTAAMARLGKCWGPRMVDVRATNAKLRARARRMVIELGRVAPADADALLARAGGRVKVALVMVRLGVGRAIAERKLVAAKGRLRTLLGSP